MPDLTAPQTRQSLVSEWAAININIGRRETVLTHVRAECEPTCSRARSTHGLGMGLPEIGWLLRANPADAITAILHDEASCTRVGVPTKFRHLECQSDAQTAGGGALGQIEPQLTGLRSSRVVEAGELVHAELLAELRIAIDRHVHVRFQRTKQLGRRDWRRHCVARVGCPGLR